MLEGEAGIGKTRLAEEALAEAAATGAVVLSTRAYPEEAALAYGAVADALRARLRAEPDWPSRVSDPALLEAARLVPELAAGRPALGPPGPLDGPGAQARFLSGVTEALSVAAAGARPGILFVDDVQWADAATLDLLGFLLRRLEGRPLLVLLAWRTTPERLLPAVVEAQRAERATIRRLRRLAAEDVQTLVSAAPLPDAGPELVARLYAETEGLPVLLVEYLSTLRTTTADDGWPLPTGARELIRARLGPVSNAGRHVLAAAAVLGRSFAAETVRATSGQDEDEIVVALEELGRHGLVRERAQGADAALDYDFGHEKIRALVYEETSAARRRLMHRRAADALALSGRDGEAAALVAHHRRLGGQEREAAEAYVRAADHARALYANADAIAHLSAALALGHPRPGELHTALGDLRTRLGDYAGALAGYEAAATLSEPGRVAALEHKLGALHHRRGAWDLAELHLRHALDAADPRDLALRARVHADLSLSFADAGRDGPAREHAGRARDLAEAAGDPRALGRAHNLLGVLATSRGALGEAIEHLKRSRALAEDLGDVEARIAALNNLALAHRGRHEVDAALALTAGALDLCATVGDRHREAALRNNLADLLHAAGRGEESMHELKRAVALFAEVGATGEPHPEVWKLARW